MLKTLVSSLLAFTLCAATAMAQDSDIGPAVGATLALDFAATDQTGAAQDFDSIKGEKGAVLVFYRSAKWCPYCQMQLIDLNMHALEEVTARGYGMAGISYDKPRDLARFHMKWRVGFPLLADEGSAMIDALGLRNEDYEEGHYAHGVPHPVILVLDSEKRVVAKLRRESYRERPEPAVLIETLDGLATEGR